MDFTSSHNLSTWPLENLEKKRKGIKRRINKKKNKGIDATAWENEYKRYTKQIEKKLIRNKLN